LTGKASLPFLASWLTIAAMEEAKRSSRAELSKFGWWWFGSLVGLCILGWAIGWLDHSTELTPDHSDALNVGLIVACIAALVSVFVIFFQSCGPVISRFILSFIAAPLLAALGVFMVAGEAAKIVEVSRDFPSGSSRTFDGILLLSRAYQTHGKGRSWNIQTMPIWSNLDITEADYDFMLKHRRPDDRRADDDDEIASEGYFCAKVKLQSAGSAIRVLNAGTYKLPSGTVGICSEMTAQNPSFEVLR